MGKLVLFLCFLFLSGCIKPHYEPQNLDLPSSWRLATNEGDTLCNLRWWEQFDDPILNELIIAALKNNQDLKVAISRVFEFFAQYRVVASNLYPTIDGNASYFRTQTSNALPGGPPPPGISRINNDFLAFFSLSWELDFWGRISGATEAAYADWLSQIEVRRGVVVTVVSSVAIAYIKLRELDSDLNISKKTLQSRLEALKIAKTRFDVGETSEMEVKQAESEVNIAAISVIEFERDIPKQEDLISILIGENPQSILRGRPLEMLGYPKFIPTGIPSDLLTRRPDIVAAEDNLIAANARVTEARALYFPQFNLTGKYGSESSKLKDFLTSPAEFWTYGLSAVQVIFDADRTFYRVEEAKAIRDERLAEYKQTILNAFLDVNDALISTRMNRKLVIEFIEQVKVLSDYLVLAKLNYSEGEADYLTVLDAERSLFNAQLRLALAQSNNLTAVVQLYRALGGGWVDDADAIATDDCIFLD